MPHSPTTILFAGGGTGGHIFPNVAILERLRQRDLPFDSTFLVSSRPLDGEILRALQFDFVPLPVQPLSGRPWRWPRFAGSWLASARSIRRLLDNQNVSAVVATGGFVSGPAVLGAHRRGLPVALVNLDAVPGRANRALARRATTIFSAYEVPAWPNCRRIGLPLRRSAIGPGQAADARRALGLDPVVNTLLVMGGSQGATSLNALFRPLLGTSARTQKVLSRWQVLHLAGTRSDAATLEQVYGQAGVPAKVLTFCQQMGLAWGAASAAISRSGAGSVAEAWANAVPTIFVPYPYHRDQHQKHNAQPLIGLGAALLHDDRIDPQANGAAIAVPLLAMLTDAAKRSAMRESLIKSWPGDGAEVVAAWLGEAAVAAGA